MSYGNAPIVNGSGAPPPGLAKLTKYDPLVSSLKPQGATLSTPQNINVIPDTPEVLAQIEAAVIDFLSKKPSQNDTLAKVGIYLRGRNLVPQEGLKKFITSRPQLFLHIDDGKGGNRARLVTSTCYTDGGGSSVFSSNYLDANHYNQLTPPGIDETLLERQLVSYIYENGTRDNPVTAPELGEYCKKDLGFSMKGYLTRFLITRKRIFCLPDDGRQHVLLQPGAAEALGVVGSLPHLPEDLLGGSGKLHLDHTNSMNDNKQRPVEYNRWDRITQEMYDFAVSRGGSVPYKEVDVYIKARCAGEIAASGISLEHWQAQRHSWKRRNLFKKEGNCLVVHSAVSVPNRQRGINGNSLDAGGGSGEKIQQEVRASLIDVAAFSELQKESAGLRTACVTLGRELLAVKDELLDLKTQLAEHGINVANTVNLNSPDANGGLLDEIFLPSDLL